MKKSRGDLAPLPPLPPSNYAPVDGKTFFDIPVKDKEEACEKIIETSKNNDYTTRSLLDYELIPGYYKLIATDLHKQEKLENPDIPHEINCIGTITRKSGVTMFFHYSEF